MKLSVDYQGRILLNETFTCLEVQHITRVTPAAAQSTVCCGYLLLAQLVDWTVSGLQPQVTGESHHEKLGSAASL